MTRGRRLSVEAPESSDGCGKGEDARFGVQSGKEWTFYLLATLARARDLSTALEMTKSACPAAGSGAEPPLPIPRCSARCNAAKPKKRQAERLPYNRLHHEETNSFPGSRDLCYFCHVELSR